MPFHDIAASDLELLDGNVIRVGYENVEYRFAPTQIIVEYERDERKNVDDLPGYDIDHREAWDRAIDLQIEEDFICISEFVEGPDGETHLFDAYWVLSSIVIENYDREGAILQELAKHGNRRYLLWELASDGRSFCGVDFVAGEHDIRHRPIEEQVGRFVEDMDAHGEMYFEDVNWEHLESVYGQRADRLLAAAGD